ncbi:aryl-sulfate sulfotransferase [Jeongeupia chitinilytica]|uniref:Thioredoxin n=1 Tax=Jeongeupia chitinilytica TaxID=1041641 RepID=A0ABQ3GZ51_9NEIS|nr:aryl-sulfate sulfotransferase [Jeongeupia chitinilytica]GHD62278.1 thioredoxin [Jeongeupia chitinilytica]
MGFPSVYPTGVTVYNPAKAAPGYTLLHAPDVGVVLLDLNGREVQVWKDLQGFPPKLLPGGQLLASSGNRDPKHAFQDQIDLVQVDWDGHIVWRFSQLEEVSDPGSETRWVARQHHDFQRAGNPVGYYAPGQTPQTDGGNTLLLVHEEVHNPAISDHVLLDDRIVEVGWDGRLLWSWRASDHIDELGFSDAARTALFRNPNLRQLADRQVGDWLHINSLSALGPNRHYDAGDARFHPDNLIWDAREANIIAIVDKQSGAIVWRLGPDYDGNDAEKKLGWIIGQHHAHLIPRGLPGEGNLLVFDNGGWAGYGAPHPASPDGLQHVRRDYSRVLEIDPVTLDVVWQYTPAEAGFVIPLDAQRFYSPFVSSAQRLSNGNTLITEGSNGRIFEVTADHELVWEYLSPYRGKTYPLHLLYRAYRAPYDWVPQLPTPVETAVERLVPASFHVPGAANERRREVTVQGVQAGVPDSAFCVAVSRDAGRSELR